MDKTQAGIVTATVIMILLVLLFGSPIKRKAQVNTTGDREAWREGRIADGKSDSAQPQQKKTGTLAFTS